MPPSKRSLKRPKRRSVSTTPRIRPIRGPIGMTKRPRLQAPKKRPRVQAPKNQSKFVKAIDKADKSLRFKKRLLKQVFV